MMLPSRKALTPRNWETLVATSDAKSCSGAATAESTIAGNGTIVARRRNGNVRVLRLGMPQKVHTRPERRSTKEMRLRKNSAASLPRMKRRQAAPVSRRPHESDADGLEKVMCRRDRKSVL